jgi:ATP-dependent RNA helicase DDX54/DBP10
LLPHTILFARYSLTDGASFVEQARGAVLDLVGDEALAERKRRTLNWDKQKKKFVKGDGIGSDNIKLVKTESGTKLPATYRSGRFEEWKAKNRSVLPRVGEIESETPNGMSGGRRYKHKRVTAESKPLDKLHNDYNRKLRRAKMREAGNVSEETPKFKGRTKSTGRYGGRSVGKAKSELKSATEIRKSRKMMEQRKAKNARPSHKKK